MKSAKATGEKTGEVTTSDYRHAGQTRTNIPTASIAAEGKVPRVPKVRYHYSPHLPPELRFDPSGQADELPELVAEAGRRRLTNKEQKQLAEALRTNQPWLEWASKREQHERGLLEVAPVALHIHERVSTQAMLRALAREDAQRDLFADPQQPYSEAVQFYRHRVDWANRLILGDSLQVMTSLAGRENLAGRVQMIYLDPPYGIRFASNFQPQVGQRDVKDRDQDLTREPETVRAYRDTWTLGVHSYLAYLRDRFIAARSLLTETGSIFIQISDENIHTVRSVLDEVFGADNFCSLITFMKTSGQTDNKLAQVADFLLWYAKDINNIKYRQLYIEKEFLGKGGGEYTRVLEQNGVRRSLSDEETKGLRSPGAGARLYRSDNLTSQSPGTRYEVAFEGRSFYPIGYWKTDAASMPRLIAAERVQARSNSLAYIRFFDDFGVVALNSVWDDTAIAGRPGDKIFVVQTAPRVVERCLLMTTDPGDLVFDPTCGSGTTAYVAEHWGRRWITCDTSRVALSLARQRLMTARFPYYQLRDVNAADEHRNPGGAWLSAGTGGTVATKTLDCRTVSHVTLKSIARNNSLDPIFSKHQSILKDRLAELNRALSRVPSAVVSKLKTKLNDKVKQTGRKSITEADRRRWELPQEQWQEWEVPFDTDSDWPTPLQEALTAYRTAWRSKMDEINACIAANAEREEIVDKPEILTAIVRVTGPFTVEGVRPEELSLGDTGLFDPTPNQFDAESSFTAGDSAERNIQPYLAQMLQHLKADGVTFLGNHRKKFGRLDGLFEDASGSLIHAEGAWDGADKDGLNSVAITFGPQHGPVTALQVEEAIRAAKRYDELVIAGFSFDAEAYTVVEGQGHPRLRIHIAQIRPDLNEAMAGLLKDTPNSQLFTVFGQPEVEVWHTKEGWVCTLKGVDIYNPVENTVRSSGADKVAAWFLDSDFDGRCFCITQAFFPDQNAWEKIAKALGSSGDPEAFAALKGTVSLPFSKGKFGRIAVKVIDPRGNEVMAVRPLT